MPEVQDRLRILEKIKIMADQQEILNTILLTRLNYFSLAGMLELYRKVGSATLILSIRTTSETSSPMPRINS